MSDNPQDVIAEAIASTNGALVPMDEWERNYAEVVLEALAAAGFVVAPSEPSAGWKSLADCMVRDFGAARGEETGNQAVDLADAFLAPYRSSRSDT